MSMSRQDMLKAMGISDGDFTDYLNRFNIFFNGGVNDGKGLNGNQKAFHLKNHGRHLADIAQSLGPTATPDDVKQLFDGAVQQPPAGAPPVQPPDMVAAISCCKNK